jgi:hypothetical protein
MGSFFQAYESFERRILRGEFFSPAGSRRKAASRAEPFLSRLGDVLIHAGLKLKRLTAAGKPLALSSISGSR